jgi:hypothetical protein
MHPITATHDWITGHPVAFPLALFVLAIPFSIYGGEIKAFLRLPPQKLGAWILKARIAGNEARLVRLNRLRTEPSYAIYILLTPSIMVVMLFTTILLQIYAVSTFLSEAISKKAFENAFSFCVACVAVVLWHTFRDFDTALKRPDGIQKVESKIAVLRSRLSQEPTPPLPVDSPKGK